MLETPAGGCSGDSASDHSADCHGDGSAQYARQPSMPGGDCGTEQHLNLWSGFARLDPLAPRVLGVRRACQLPEEGRLSGSGVEAAAPAAHGPRHRVAVRSSARTIAGVHPGMGGVAGILPPKVLPGQRGAGARTAGGAVPPVRVPLSGRGHALAVAAPGEGGVLAIADWVQVGRHPKRVDAERAARDGRIIGRAVEPAPPTSGGGRAPCHPRRLRDRHASTWLTRPRPERGRPLRKLSADARIPGSAAGS